MKEKIKKEQNTTPTFKNEEGVELFEKIETLEGYRETPTPEQKGEAKTQMEEFVEKIHPSPKKEKDVEWRDKSVAPEIQGYYHVEISPELFDMRYFDSGDWYANKGAAGWKKDDGFMQWLYVAEVHARK